MGLGADCFSSMAVIAEVEEELLPNRLCTYLFELSQVFKRFYDQVLACSKPPNSRPLPPGLLPTRATSSEIKAMGLLGIPRADVMQ